jgi:hypothetical protein
MYKVERAGLSLLLVVTFKFNTEQILGNYIQYSPITFEARHSIDTQAQPCQKHWLLFVKLYQHQH